MILLFMIIKMTDKNQTSRHWLLDAIECIKNCEAVVSHCNEISDAYYDAYMALDLSQEWIEDNEVVKRYELCWRMKDIATKVRRNIMSRILEMFEGDDQFRCIFKHAVSAKQYIDEVNDAADEMFYQEWQNLYKLMSLAISKFVGEEPETCARCLWDKLLSHNEEE